MTILYRWRKTLVTTVEVQWNVGIGEKDHPHLQQDLGSLKYGVGEAAEPIPISLPKN